MLYLAARGTGPGDRAARLRAGSRERTDLANPERDQRQPAVVISQVYGGGGNASAPFQNDFIELFNRTSSPVPVDGWSVQYASATGTGLFSANVTLLAGTIAPGHYYLVRESGGTTGIPPADAGRRPARST